MIERQSIVLFAGKGVYTSKPRPWLVIQSDDFALTDSVLLCAFTHVLIAGAARLRIDVAPSAANGLRIASQIQVEKIVTVRRSDLGRIVGRLEDEPMRELEAAIRDVLGLSRDLSL